MPQSYSSWKTRGSKNLSGVNEEVLVCHVALVKSHTVMLQNSSSNFGISLNKRQIDREAVEVKGRGEEDKDIVVEGIFVFLEMFLLQNTMQRPTWPRSCD